MNPETQFYVTTLIVYAAVAVIACWGLDLHFGDTGLLNLSFIVSHAAGAYAAALLTLGPPDDGGETLTQQYFWGADLPFPLPFVGAVIVGALISVPIGFVALQRLRADYQAIAMLSIALIAGALVVAAPNVLGGGLGLYLIPAPLEDTLALTTTQYAWAYSGFAVVLAALSGWLVVRISRSPVWRVLRSIRENPDAAEALGINVVGVRMASFAVGNALGALSGALLVSFIGAWAPTDWPYEETLILLGAVIIGGAGNRFGVLLGALILPVALSEGLRYLPSLGQAGTTEALQYVLIGLVILAFLWLRPQGIFPERRRVFGVDGRAVPAHRTLLSRRSDAVPVTQPDLVAGGQS
jgi:branched-chain amino acid transport system permease protein